MRNLQNLQNLRKLGDKSRVQQVIKEITLIALMIDDTHSLLLGDNSNQLLINNEE